MKKLPVILILFLYAALLAGQTADTTFFTIHQEDKPLEKQQFVDAYDILFGTMQPTRWLFTLNMTTFSGDNQGLFNSGSPFQPRNNVSLSNTYGSQDMLRLGAEVKVTPGISIQGTYGIGVGYSPANYFYQGFQYQTHRFGIMPRWYYAMPRQIRQGSSANNMSGNYVGLEAVYAQTNNLGYVANKQTAIALRYGIQRRLFRHGFLDLNFGIGIKKNNYENRLTRDENKWKLLANSKIGFGMALAQPKSSPSTGGYCDVLRCFREERQMWKLDLYNLIKISDINQYKGQLSLSYERKIGTSPFSIETQGMVGVGHNSYKADGSVSFQSSGNQFQYGGYIQPRYYYAKNRSIAKGKSGNNLSGVYVGGQFQWLETQESNESSFCDSNGCQNFTSTLNSQNKGVGLVWGIQHRLFQHGFIDFSVRGALDLLSSKTKNMGTGETTKNPDQKEYNVLFKLRAGLAF